MVKLSRPAGQASGQHAPTQLAVLPIGPTWAVLVNGEAQGDFESQDAALRCVRSIVEFSWLRNSIDELLISTPAGEVVHVPAI